jgi:polyisoprenyl-teichoic acid--peptidoglycan teichoic acid transferase
LMAPGRFSTADEFALSYWLVDQLGTYKLMSTHFDLPKNQANILPNIKDLSIPPVSALVKVAIQDSLKSPQGVKKANNLLLKLGYEDVRVGEHPWSLALEKTQIIAQSGDIAMAQQLRDRLGIGEVVVESTGELQSDVTVRLGKDWLKYQVVQSQQNSR